MPASVHDWAGWLAPALRAQSQAASVLTAAVCAAWLIGVPLSGAVQIDVVMVGMAVIGIPHGAFDHLVARSALAPRLGAGWWAPFLAGYLGLAGLVWLAWTLAPASTLVGFVALSVLHFGLGDVEDGLAPRGVPRTLAVLAYGAMPILVPVALHPEQAAPVLALLAGRSPAAVEAALRLTVWLMPLWGLAFAWVVLAAWRERRPVVERVVMAAGFVLLPPLLAFGLYFALGHAVRHVLRLGAWHAPGRPSAAAWWLARTLLPAAALCGIGLVLFAWREGAVATITLAAVFRLIAALTLPHMLVTLWLDGERTRKGP